MRSTQWLLEGSWLGNAYDPRIAEVRCCNEMRQMCQLDDNRKILWLSGVHEPRDTRDCRSRESGHPFALMHLKVDSRLRGKTPAYGNAAPTRSSSSTSSE